MPKEKEYGIKMRLLKILFLIVEQPFRYKKKEIIARFQVNKSTIDRDFEVFKNLGLLLDIDEKYRYGFKTNQPYKQLHQLLHFTEEDQLLLGEAIDKISSYSRRGETLKKKLASLYDYHRLGHVYLRKPYMERMNLLQKGIDEKRQVILQNYRSTNSNVITDRRVEPFHINPPEDVVQCYDVDKQKLRFFRMSRIEKVVVLEDEWQKSTHHYIMATDPFRIVDNQQLMVHIRMKVGAYNDLLERFPLTKNHLEQCDESEWHDFQCPVNHKFIGLSNFLLGNWKGVEIIEPESLREYMNGEVEKVRF